MINNNSVNIPDFGIFKGIKVPNKKPAYCSKSGSKYWYGNDKNGNFIIRASNHWSKVFGNVNITIEGHDVYGYMMIQDTLKECNFIGQNTWILITNNNKDRFQAGKMYV